MKNFIFSAIVWLLSGFVVFGQASKGVPYVQGNGGVTTNKDGGVVIPPLVPLSLDSNGNYSLPSTILVGNPILSITTNIAKASTLGSTFTLYSASTNYTNAGFTMMGGIAVSNNQSADETQTEWVGYPQTTISQLDPGIADPSFAFVGQTFYISQRGRGQNPTIVVDGYIPPTVNTYNPTGLSQTTKSYSIPNDANNWLITVTLQTAGYHTVRVFGGSPIYSICCSRTNAVFPWPTLSPALTNQTRSIGVSTVCFFGDSITEKFSNAGNSGMGFGSFADFLEVDPTFARKVDFQRLGEGGTGWLATDQPGTTDPLTSGVRTNAIGRIPDLLAYNPKYLICTFGQNDGSLINNSIVSSNELYTNIYRFMTNYLPQARPDQKRLITGSLPFQTHQNASSGQYVSDQCALLAALNSGFLQNSNQFLSFILPSFITSVYTTPLNGNAYNFTDSTDLHPNINAMQGIANFMKPWILGNWPELAGGVTSYTSSGFIPFIGNTGIQSNSPVSISGSNILAASGSDFAGSGAGLTNTPWVPVFFGLVTTLASTSPEYYNVSGSTASSTYLKAQNQAPATGWYGMFYGSAYEILNGTNFTVHITNSSGYVGPSLVFTGLGVSSTTNTYVQDTSNFFYMTNGQIFGIVITQPTISAAVFAGLNYSLAFHP